MNRIFFYFSIIHISFIGIRAADRIVEDEISDYQEKVGRIFANQFIYSVKVESTGDGITTLSRAMEKGMLFQLDFSKKMVDYFISNGFYQKSLKLPCLYKSDETRRISGVGLSFWHDGLVSRYPSEVEPFVYSGLMQYIREKGPDFFYKFYRSYQLENAYNFALAYRDVFSTVDTEHAADIQTQAKKWLVEIQTNVQGKLSLHARKAGALQAVDPNLTAQELTEATTVIAMFPVGSPMRTALQTHWDQALDEERQTRLRQMPVSLGLLKTATNRLLGGQ